jgi:hypothetical protein
LVSNLNSSFFYKEETVLIKRKVFLDGDIEVALMKEERLL